MRLLLILCMLLFSSPLWAMEHLSEVLFDNKGNAIKDASVAVYLSGTSTPATIYSDNGVTTKANPFTTSHATNSPGAYDFYAADGVYDIVFSKAGYSFNPLLTKRLALFDVTSGSAGIGAGSTSFPPSPTLGQVVVITDDSATGACDSAGGTSVTLCRWNGSAWVKLGDGTGAGGSLAASDIDTSAELAAILTDEVGSGAVVLSVSPVLTTPILTSPTINGTISGTATIIPEDGVIATPLTTLFGRELWVEDFGLVGQANDAVVFQAAINAVNSSGKGILHLPCSTLNIGSAITYGSNITFKGCGMGVSFINPTSSLPLTTPMMANANPAPGDNVRTDTNVFFEDFTMDGAARDYPAWDVGTVSPATYGGLIVSLARGNMLRMYSVLNGGITRVELKNHESLGINLAGSRGIKITESWFHNNGKVDDISSPVYVPVKSFTNGGVTPTADIQVFGNLFSENLRSAMTFSPLGGGNVTSNRLYGNGESSIFSEDGAKIFIVGNDIRGAHLTDITAHGVEINHCIGCEVSANMITDTDTTGIAAVGMVGGAMKGNTILRPGLASVYPGGPFNFAAGRAPGDPLPASQRSGITLTTGNVYPVLNVQLSDNKILDDAVSPTMQHGIGIVRTGTPTFTAQGVDLIDNCIKGYAVSKFNFVSQAMSSTVRVKDCGTTDAVDAPTYGANIAIDNRLANTHIITPTNGNAFAIGDPANDATGDIVRVTINNTFGTLGTATWNAAYTLVTPWVQPPNGSQSTITFINNGTTLQEISRSGAGGGGTFDTLEGGTNTFAAMAVGSGATLNYSGTGVINASSFRGNTVVAVADGGTNLTAAADDTVMIGNSTTWIAATLPSCSNGTTSKLLYSTSTNAFSCGTDQSSGGGTTFDGIGSGTNTTMAAVVSTGASIGVAGTGTVTSTNFWPTLLTVNAGNSPYTALTSDATILCDTTAAPRTITLPAATVKVLLTFFNLGSNTCTINRAGADTISTGISSSSSFVIRNPGSTFWLQPDGVSVWYVGG